MRLDLLKEKFVDKQVLCMKFEIDCIVLTFTLLSQHASVYNQ